MTLSTKIDVFYGFYTCLQWAFIHALLSRVTFALAGLSCYCSVYNTAHLICLPYSTVYRRRPSFSGRRCSCLEQSARTCHFRTFCGCLPVPSEDTSVWHIISRPRVIVQCLRSDARCFWTL